MVCVTVEERAGEGECVGLALRLPVALLLGKEALGQEEEVCVALAEAGKERPEDTEALGVKEELTEEEGEAVSEKLGVDRAELLRVPEPLAVWEAEAVEHREAWLTELCADTVLEPVAQKVGEPEGERLGVALELTVAEAAGVSVGREVGEGEGDPVAQNVGEAEPLAEKVPLALTETQPEGERVPVPEGV